MFGTQDLVIALVVGAVFFGAKRLPEIARSLGRSMQEFKKGVAGETADDASPKPAGEPSPAIAPAPRTCMSCQTALVADGKVCPRCGTSVEHPVTPGSPSSG